MAEPQKTLNGTSHFPRMQSAPVNNGGGLLLVNSQWCLKADRITQGYCLFVDFGRAATRSTATLMAAAWRGSYVEVSPKQSVCKQTYLCRSRIRGEWGGRHK
jgi:hypothetical protein